MTDWSNTATATWSNIAMATCPDWFIYYDDLNKYAGTAIWQPSSDHAPIPTSDHAPIPTKVKCVWCGQVNRLDREECRGCGAPLI